MSKKSKKVTKSKKKKGLESIEIFQWLLMTIFFVALPVMIIYGFLNEFLNDVYYFMGIPLDIGEGIALIVITIWTFVSATFIVPSFQRD